PDESKLSPDELLLRGHYHLIPPGKDKHGKAVWAFARYHLAPAGDVYDSAAEAHQQGDLLGTFVVILCHRDGIGVRRDEKLMWKLHYVIRQQLEKKKDPSPVELYLLAQTEPVNEEGVVKLPDKVNYKDYKEGQDKQKQERLEQAANGGFAEACATPAQQSQHQKDYPKALAWFEKAGESGLASGLRGKGFLLMTGQGVPKDAKAAFAAGNEAAKRGDAFAMLNVAAYHDRGWGTDV